MITATALSRNLTSTDVMDLYRKYDAELRGLCRTLRAHYHHMTRRGYFAAFSDVEGEILYLLVRETKPDLVCEISPSNGWSTNYLLAALTANGTGTLHSFELAPRIRGRSTEAVIRGNQCQGWDQHRLVIHIGDARHTVPQMEGVIDLLLIDSCHTEAFAQWYTTTVFPRVDGLILVQDIAYVDQLEPSSEAAYLWAWAGRQQVPLTVLGMVEEALEREGLRRGYATRRDLRSNAVLFTSPHAPSPDGLPDLDGSPRHLIIEADRLAKQGASEQADRFLNDAAARLLRMPQLAYRHRPMLESSLCYDRIGEIGEAQRCVQRALGMALQADTRERIKALGELLEHGLAHRCWRLVAQTAALMALEPLARPLVVQIAKKFLKARFLKKPTMSEQAERPSR